MDYLLRLSFDESDLRERRRSAGLGPKSIRVARSVRVVRSLRVVRSERSEREDRVVCTSRALSAAALLRKLNTVRCVFSWAAAETLDLVCAEDRVALR
ncbi:hypothetical protein, partial [uncultured Atopobium sp.]|uniref:hypothetical protein n=1 Tax=uncultured Atopobium sp. TaxID=274587 RepID=UPI0025F54C7A